MIQAAFKMRQSFIMQIKFKGGSILCLTTVPNVVVIPSRYHFYSGFCPPDGLCPPQGQVKPNAAGKRQRFGITCYTSFPP
jgi:hypothetical protein